MRSCSRSWPRKLRRGIKSVPVTMRGYLASSNLLPVRDCRLILSCLCRYIQSHSIVQTFLKVLYT